MKLFTKIVGILLSLLILVSAPMQVLAATPEYVSDLRISVADTEEKAKAQLCEMGYTVFDGDLNAGAGKTSTLSNKKYVYLGYKTTSDSKEAITDISVMNMNGSYSMGEYENALSNKADYIDDLLKDFVKITKEFQANYKNGKKTAWFAYQLLNQFKEDDSELCMGDFLVTYAQDDAQLTKVFMQGNHTVLVFMFRALAIGCTDNGQETNWLQKFSEADPYDYYEPETYDDSARKILKVWDTQRELLLKCTKAMEELSFDTQESVEEYLQSLTAEEKYNLLECISYYTVLDSYEYDRESMVEFFLKDGDDLDISELYPLVSCLTEGQQEAVGYVGVDFLARYAFMSDEELENRYTDFQNLLKSVDCKDVCSIYIGIDRKLFDGGVAFTDSANRECNANANNDWATYNVTDDDITQLNIITGALSGVTVLAGIGEKVLNTVKNVVIKKALNGLKASGIVSALANKAFLGKLCSGTLEIFAGYFNNLLIINIGITLIKLSVKIAKDLYDYYHPEYTEIPKTMIDIAVSDDVYQYVHYHAVSDVAGNTADVNGWDAKQWNAIYFTKDANAGVSLTTDMLRVEGDSSLQTRYMAVHYFGESGAYNLNKYSYNDKVDGIYLHIKKSVVSLNASAFSTHHFALWVGISFVIGTAIGGLCVYGFKKYSKRGVKL